MQERTYNAFYGYLGVRILTWVVRPMFVLVKHIDLVALSQHITKYGSTWPASNISIQDAVFLGLFFGLLLSDPSTLAAVVPDQNTRLESSIQMFKRDLMHASLFPRQVVPAWHNHTARHI